MTSEIAIINDNYDTISMTSDFSFYFLMEITGDLLSKVWQTVKSNRYWVARSNFTAVEIFFKLSVYVRHFQYFEKLSVLKDFQ